MDKEFFRWFWVWIKRMPGILVRSIPKYWLVILINIVLWGGLIYFSNFNSPWTLLFFVLIVAFDVPYFIYKIYEHEIGFKQ